MHTAHVNIGSNLGERNANLEAAFTGICALENVSEARRSRIIESEPWGYESENGYLNMGVQFKTSLTPDGLLDGLDAVVSAIDPRPHRDAAGRYADRVIDIDLIAYDDMICNTPRLVLPHPRMHLRGFVLLPMKELWPSWKHPILNKTVSELCSGIN